MISRVIRKTVDLDAIQKVDQLEGPLYQLEESGHTFEITCMSGGAAAAVSGTVSGRFLRADETTVYFTGTLSGNVASITLPQSCYNVNGRFGLVVFISGSNVTSAIYAVAGNVYRSTSDTIIDPTGEIPSLEELMAQIEACEEATASAQQAASFVNSIIAPTYSTGVSYAIGDYCTYEGSMYRCTAATSGDFDPSDWEMVLVGGEFKRVDGDANDLKSDVEKIKMVRTVTPTVVNNLNFAVNATAYSTSGSHTVRYIKLEKGTLYHIKAQNISTSTAYFRHILSENVPANGVAGTFMKENTVYGNSDYLTDYISASDLYYGIASGNWDSLLVTITSESGDIVIPLQENVQTEQRYLTSDDFEQGSLNEGCVYNTNADCIALKKYYAVNDSVDKLYFENLDTTKKWKIRCLFYDADTKFMMQAGYQFFSEISIPEGARYFRFSISPYQNDGTTAITNITPSAVNPYTLRISLHLSEQTNKTETDSEFDLIEQSGHGYLHGDFIHGSLISGEVYHIYESAPYSITSYKKFVFDRDITLTPDAGYKFGIHSFGTSGDSFVSDSGWQTSAYTIPAHTYFRIIIREVSGSAASGFVDVYEYVRAVKVTTLITELKHPITSGSEIPWEIGSLIDGYDYENDLRIRSPYVRVKAGTVITFRGAANSLLLNGYDEKLVFDLNRVHQWTDGNTAEIEADGYVRILLKKASGSITENEIPGLAALLTIQYPNNISEYDVWKTASDIKNNLIDGRRYSYTGEKIETEHYLWYEPYYIIESHSSGTDTAMQGATVYGKYLFLAYNKNPMISVFDFVEKVFVANMSLTAVNTYHCNNINFGTQKYDPGDDFPLLYVSMENIAEHKCLVYRIQESSGTWTATLVQTITYPDPATIGAYYPNCILDNDNGVMYITSYTTNSYVASESNNIRICKYTTPLLSQGNVTLNYADKLDEFLIPSITATQGAYVFNGKIIEVFGTAGNAFLVQIDPLKKKIVTKISLDDIGLTAEPESVFMYKGDIYIFQITGNIVKMYLD